jgi:micrococcal nuclease
VTRLLLTSVTILFFTYPALADFTGSVVSVLDGDTIEVLHNTHPERIRLNGIDCPEKGQAFGTRAKEALSAFVFGRDVILQTHGQDKYKRTLADVFLRDGTPRQSCIGQRRLVLVVSKVCAQRCDAQAA